MMKLTILLMLAPAAPAAAQDHAMAEAPMPVCPRDAAPLPSALAGWTIKTPIVAGRTSGATAVAQVGRGYTLTLAPSAGVTFAVAPKRTVSPGSFSGTVRFSVATAGTYRVALGAAAWVDVVGASGVLPSTGHAHGPACSGIRKIVDFALKPGGYTLQIVGNAAATLPIEIAPAS